MQYKDALILHFIEMECWSVVIQWGNSAALPLRCWGGQCGRGGHCLSTWVKIIGWFNIQGPGVKSMLVELFSSGWLRLESEKLASCP